MNFLRPLAIVVALLSTLPAVSQDAAGGEKKPVDQFKRQEVIVIDSTPSSELMKRAVEWVKAESKRFTKTNGVTTGSKAECTATFKIRPKELNPISDYTGTITMLVSIECKENKYRYVISGLKHTSTSGKASGGDLNNVVPDCGSMIMPDNTWKKIKGEAIKNSEMVVSELKDHMFFYSAPKKDEW